jgi:hypothetical protein
MAGDIEVIWVRRQANNSEKQKYFLPKGLDRANQLDPAQQIRFYAQIREAVGWVPHPCVTASPLSPEERALARVSKTSS